MAKCGTCRHFGANNDKFGKQVRIHYRDKVNYGTAFGGWLSIIARLMILTLAFGQVYACFFDIKYYETWLDKQIEVPNLSTTFNITYDEGFPAFSVYLPKDLEHGIEKSSYNNETVFNFTFQVVE